MASPAWNAFRQPLSLAVLLLSLLGAAAPRSSAELKTPVWIQDASGGSASITDTEKFHAWIGGKPARVQSVHPPDGNLILLVVMDVVNDMVRVDAARTALIQAFEKFKSSQFVALLRAQDGLQVLVEPTSDRESVKDSLLNLPVSGFPGLLESIEDAAAIGDKMLRASDVRVAVLYITDGSIYEYRGDYTNPVINPSDGGDLSRRFRDRLIQERMKRTMGAVISSWTPLFFLHLESRRDQLNMVYQNGLTQFAGLTAGDALFCESLSQVPAYLDQLIDKVRGFHLLSIETPPELGGRVRLRLEVDGYSEIQYREQFEIAKVEDKKKKGRK